MDKIKYIVRSNKGFTLLEAVLSLFVLSVAMLVLFSVIVEINNVDNKSKEMNYSLQLLEPYLSYYKNLDVSEKNLDTFLSDVGTVDLVKEAKSYNLASVPKNLSSLKLICENSPEVILNEKGQKEYIKFVISCEKDGNKINKGNPFIIIRFIN